MAVSPSPERDTEMPCEAFPTAPEPTSLVPCWVQTPALLVQTHAAPALLLSVGPPAMDVLPSAERDTEMPCQAPPTAPVPTNFGPCCKNCARTGWEESSVAEKTAMNAAVSGKARAERLNSRIFISILYGRRSSTLTRESIDFSTCWLKAD